MDGYYAWMIVATAFVLMMTCPALALFYGGMTRSKSVLNMMMMSFVAMGVVGIIWVLWGWSMSFGPDDGTFFANPFTLFGLRNFPTGSWIFMMFQLTFAAITAALISGAIADRVKLSAWLVFLPFWITLSYFPLAHMVFSCSEKALICTRIGAQDYAGGTAVHINAGMAGLVLAAIIGKRVGWPKEPMRPHNLTLTMIGAGLLWVGWYGFNVGSIVFGDGYNDKQFFSETGRTFTNTTIATMAAMLAWLLVERMMHGKATSLGAASGIVAGLVAITPACGAVDPVGGIVIGAVAGAGCAVAVGLKFRLNLDDSLDVIGVHLVGGILGTLLIGFFSTSNGAGGVDGLFYGGGFDSLWAQFRGVLVAVAWSGVVTAILGFAIKYTMGWRVTDEAEVEGIDFDQHGETAYDLHTSISGTGTGVIAAATTPLPSTVNTEGARA